MDLRPLYIFKVYLSYTDLKDIKQWCVIQYKKDMEVWSSGQEKWESGNMLAAYRNITMGNPYNSLEELFKDNFEEFL